LLIDIENLIIINKNLREVILQYEIRIEKYNKEFSSEEYSLRQNIEVLNKSVVKGIEINSSKEFIERSSYEIQQLKLKLENLKRQSVFLEKVDLRFDESIQTFKVKSKSVIQIANGSTINNLLTSTDTYTPNLANIMDAKVNKTTTNSTTINNNNYTNQSSSNYYSANTNTNNNYIANANYSKNTNYSANTNNSVNNNYSSNNNYPQNVNFSNDFVKGVGQNIVKNIILPSSNKYATTTQSYSGVGSKNASNVNLVNYGTTSSYNNNVNNYGNIYSNNTYSRNAQNVTQSTASNNYQVRNPENPQTNVPK
jgi:hypothetical protein